MRCQKTELLNFALKFAEQKVPKGGIVVSQKALEGIN